MCFASFLELLELDKVAVALAGFQKVFMLAEGGAMGEPGAVNIITLENQCPHIYHANYCFGDFDMDKLADVFTPLQTFDCGIFGDVSGVASGWNHVYLGAGNHLLVRDLPYPLAMCEIIL